MGNKRGVKAEAIGTYRTILSFEILLDLPNTFYVSSFSRNLLPLSPLDLEGYMLYFENKSFTFSKNENFIGNGILCDELYKMNIVDTKFLNNLYVASNS